MGRAMRGKEQSNDPRVRAARERRVRGPVPGQKAKAQTPARQATEVPTTISRWGAEPASSKTSAQHSILQFAGALSCFGVLVLGSGAILAGTTNDVRPQAEQSQTWLILRGSVAMVLSVFACLLRSYWTLTDFQGSTKLRTFIFATGVDFLVGLVAVIRCCMSALTSSFFWWAGTIAAIVLLLGEGIQIRDMVRIAGREQARRAQERNNSAPHQSGAEAQPGSGQEQKSHAPSAPPPEATDLEMPTTTSSMVEVEAVPVGDDMTTDIAAIDVQVPPMSPAAGDTMSPEEFESVWLQLPTLYSSPAVLKVAPSIADMKMKLTSRHGFQVVAWGRADGSMRVYFCGKLPDARDHLLLGEFLIEEEPTPGAAGSGMSGHQLLATFKCTSPHELNPKDPDSVVGATRVLGAELVNVLSTI